MGPRSITALVVLTLCAAPAVAGDLSDFKRAWARSQRLEETARVDARLAALEALANGAGTDEADVLLQLSLDGSLDYRVRDAAEAALHDLSGAEMAVWASGGLEKARGKRGAARRVGLCRYLAARAGRDAETGLLLLPALKDDAPEVQLAAIAGLSQIRKVAAVEALVQCLEGATGRVAADAARALTQLTGERQPTTEAWVDWWRAKRDGFVFPEAAPGDGGDGAPEAGRTVTRLDPPGDAGESIYEVDSGNVLFVVDVSGSMQVKCQDTTGRARTRLQYVQEALIGAIEAQLDEDDRFNLIAFSTEVTPWRRKLVEASDKQKKKARAWIRRLKPVAETNIYDTLELAFKLPGVDTIYFLSDGTPTAGSKRIPDDVFGDVRKWNAGRGVRVNVIGFMSGDAAPYGIVESKGMARRFLERLAQENDGTARFFE